MKITKRQLRQLIIEGLLSGALDDEINEIIDIIYEHPWSGEERGSNHEKRVRASIEAFAEAKRDNIVELHRNLVELVRRGNPNRKQLNLAIRKAIYDAGLQLSRYSI